MSALECIPLPAMQAAGSVARARARGKAARENYRVCGAFATVMKGPEKQRTAGGWLA